MDGHVRNPVVPPVSARIRKGRGAPLALRANGFGFPPCLFAVLLLGLSGCASNRGGPGNLSLLKDEIVRYVDSGRYAREMEMIAKDAMVWIERRATKPGDPGRALTSKLAVVFDIDETIVSNLPHMRAMDFGYLPAAWSEWLDRGEAPAIEPVREIYRRVRELGLSVIFITGRRERERVGTEKNLRAIGVEEYAMIFFKPDESKETSEKFKTDIRSRLVSEGWVIIANLGDQESDLAGGFAEKTFKLPAPFYFSR